MEEGIVFWLQWQVPISALMIMGPAFFSFYTIKNVKTEPLYFHNLWKPCWRFLNPLWLLFFRVCAFICLTPMLYEIIAIDGAFAFYFYTQWTFALVMLYFSLAIVISGYGCFVFSRTENGEIAEFLKRNLEDSAITNGEEGFLKLQNQYGEGAFRVRCGFWGYAMQAIYQTCAGAVILTDVVFWCVLVPFTHLELNVLMGCMHSLNAVFLLLDSGLNSLPFPWFRLAYFVLWSCLYIVFQWVIHACGFTWWPYPFLDLDTPWAPIWYFLLAAIHVPCYGIYALIVKSKNTVFSKWSPCTFVRTY
ncbi:uncharacterized protein LOC126686479 [Mercurialis annua]|uniref:uncharacterized protein LOC126686479 n=1 Tax=Mercurialis annua TaxID=3986 RepID=UPI0021604EA4|nr:uncharacterized protein LOC126686479 [Mercurialis annua]